MSDSNKKNRFNMNLTQGDPLKVILIFALPLFLSNLFQQFYNLTDTAIIGHALGDEALSAIGAVSVLYNIFISLIFGLTNGFAVIVSNCFGAGDSKRLKRSVANSILLGIICVAVLVFTGLVFLKGIMGILDVPADLYEAAASYITIIIATLPLSLAYNICASFLRAIGNAVAPLIILVCSAVLNVALDYTFVCVFDFGISGAAVATALAQLISAIVCFIYILKKVPELHISKSDLKFDGSLMGNLFASGISFAMMFTVVNIGTFFLQRAINGLGNDIIAAHTTARKIDSFCMMPVSTIASSMATFSGQNHGAGKHRRIIEGLKKSILASFVIIVLLIVFIFVLGDEVSYLISGSENQTIIGLSHKYLNWNLPFFFVLSILCVARNTLQGVGSKIAPIICSVMEMAIKVVMAEFLVDRFGYDGIIICEPITWIVCAIFIMIVFFTNRHIKPALKRSDVVTSDDP